MGVKVFTATYCLGSARGITSFSGSPAHRGTAFSLVGEALNERRRTSFGKPRRNAGFCLLLNPAYGLSASKDRLKGRFWLLRLRYSSCRRDLPASLWDQCYGIWRRGAGNERPVECPDGKRGEALAGWGKIASGRYFPIGSILLNPVGLKTALMYGYWRDLRHHNGMDHKPVELHTEPARCFSDRFSRTNSKYRIHADTGQMRIV